jgi:hypothetical protein
MRSGNRTMLTTMALMLAAAPMTSALADDGGLTWVIAPYLWLSSVHTNLNVSVPPIQNDSTTKFDNLLDKVSFAIEGHVEAQGDNFGGFGDLIYINFHDRHDFSGFNTNSSLSMSVSELAAVWSPDDKRYNGFEGFAGVRNFGTTFEFKFYPVNPEIPQARVRINQNWTDFMIGGRYTTDLSDRWGLTFRADGGFGDTDSNYNLSAMARYRTGNGAWLFGYRYMDTQFKAANTKLDLSLYGPVVSYAFVF